MLVPPTRRPRTFEAVSKQPKLSEAAVSAQIHDFLEKGRGWYPERMQYVNAEKPDGGRLVAGKRGMEDWRYTYFLGKTRPGLTCTIFIENKREGARMYCECAKRALERKRGTCTACSQKNYRADMESRGALFGPGDSIDKFMEWYEEAFAWLHDGTVAGQIGLQF